MIQSISSVQFPAIPGQHVVPPFRTGNVRRVELFGTQVRVWLEHTDNMSDQPVPCTFTCLRPGPNQLNNVGGFAGSIISGGSPLFIYGSCFAAV